jgi:glucose-6-phosphate 1-dehydrogenase
MATAERSDALVFFGASGDLAFKDIFPALQGLAASGQLDIPVIGVSRSEWTRDDLVARARASVEAHGGADPVGFPRLAEQLKYVRGDYSEHATYEQIRDALGQAAHPCTTSRFRRADSRTSCRDWRPPGPPTARA